MVSQQAFVGNIVIPNPLCLSRTSLEPLVKLCPSQPLSKQHTWSRMCHRSKKIIDMIGCGRPQRRVDFISPFLSSMTLRHHRNQSRNQIQKIPALGTEFVTRKCLTSPMSLNTKLEISTRPSFSELECTPLDTNPCKVCSSCWK